ncbi:ankyrin repeat-containing domain protein [Apodospora peruviana]|uniref:Ankyrin repeat-containing domain protein n=1 Tax=Apodospora peruviana TaxID=516989 RepID=A0AAE0HZL8_9PEZI|nr:ankyrin repeat-containing domain protein [Apodospora peruviana]
MFTDFLSANTFLEVDKLSRELDRARILDWLGGGSDVQNHHGEPCPGTGDCFIGSDAFKDWTQRPPSLLWCHGAPGVGKSLLAKIAARSLAGNCVASYFCHFAVLKDMQTAHVILRTILRQVVQQVDAETISGLIKFCPDPEKLQSTRGVGEVLAKACEIQKNVFLILDGPDELREPGEILECLKELTSINSGCRVLVTSRNIPQVRNILDFAQEFEIHAYELDIGAFVGSRFRSCDMWDDAAAVVTFSQEVVQKASGSFLLARLMTDHLLQLTTVGEMRAVLREAPTELRQEYEAVLLRIDSQSVPQRALARRAIGWITHAQRPFTVGELTHALATKAALGGGGSLSDYMVKTDTLLRVCQGLVIISPDDSGGRGTIRMIHASAHEFFRDHLYEDGHCPLDIAGTCLASLCMPHMMTGPCATWTEMTQRLATHPFLAYASQFWGHHIENQLMEQKLHGDIMKLLGSEKLRESSFQCLQLPRDITDEALASLVFDSIPTGQTALHLATYWKLQLTTSFLLEQGTEPSASNSQGWTPLHWACWAGGLGVVKILLQNKADVNAVDAQGWTPLFWPCYFGHVECVNLLLSHGANHCVQTGTGWSALHWAVSRQHVQVAQILLQHHSKQLTHPNTNVRTKLMLRYLPLKEAVRHRDSGDYKRDYKRPRQEQGHISQVQQPLDLAAELGNGDMLSLFASDPQSLFTGYCGTGPLWTELKKRWKSHGFDRSPPVSDPWRTYFKRQPGWRYEWYAYEAKVPQQIRSQSAEWTSDLLLGAIRDARLEPMKILIHCGADVNYDAGQNRNPRYPLHAAAYRRDSEYVRILLESGADPNIYDKRQGSVVTALHLAILNGFTETAAVLIRGGADVNAFATLFIKRSPIASSCYLAAENSTMRLSMQDRWLQVNELTPLMLASTVGKLQWFGRSMSDFNDDEATALSLVRILLDNGADVAQNCAASGRMTALHAAAATGNIDVCAQLIESGADVTAVDEFGRSSIHCLAQHYDHRLESNTNESGAIDKLRMVIELVISKCPDEGSKTRLFAPLNLNGAILELYTPKLHHENKYQTSEFELQCLKIASHDNPPTISLKCRNWALFSLLMEFDEKIPETIDILPLLWAASQHLQDSIVSRLVRAWNDRYEPRKPVFDNRSLTERDSKLSSFPHNFVLTLVKTTIQRPKNGPVLHPLASFRPILLSLVQAGADVNGINHFTPAKVDDNNTRPEALQKELTRSGRDNEKSSYTAIMLLAEQTDSVEMIGDLLDVGADPFSTNSRELDSFLLAAIGGNHLSLQRLLKYALENPPSSTEHWARKLPAIWSAAANVVEVLCHCIEAFGAMNKGNGDGRTLLHHAAGAGNLELVKSIISHSGNPAVEDSVGLVPLQVAVIAGHTNVAKELLPVTIMQAVSQADYIQMLMTRPTTNTDAKSVLEIAVDADNLPMVLFLLKHAYALPPNEKITSSLEQELQTLFIKTIKKGKTDIANLLLAVQPHIVDPDLEDPFGWRPLHHACLNGRTAIASQLLLHGADPNARTTEWKRRYASDLQPQTMAASVPALHMAARELDKVMVKELLAHGADIHAQIELRHELWYRLDKYPRQTALQTAVWSRNPWEGNKQRVHVDRWIEVLQTLVNHGAADVETGPLEIYSGLTFEDVLAFEGREDLWDTLRARFHENEYIEVENWRGPKCCACTDT